jgi:type I restriction enzyme S subunit
MPAVEYEDVEAGRGTLAPSFTLKKGKSGIRFESGDVLYGKLRPYLGNRLKPNFRGVAVGDWWVLVPSSVANSFLFSLIQSPMFVTVANQSSGSKMPRADWKLVGSAAFGIPSLAEQHRIGDFFSTLDSLIAAAERQETLLRRKKQAYLQLMFPREGETQPRLRFAGFSGGWERRQLREVAVKTGSGGTPTSSNPRYYGGSIPFLGIGDINGRYVDTTQKTLTEEGVANSAAWIVPEGAISLAMYASYGKSAILARPMATSQAFFNIVFRSNVTRDFVFSRLQCAESRHEWDVLVSTGTQPNLSGSKLKKWTIGYPSLPEQHHIGEFFKVLDSLIAAAEERTKALTALKSVYLQRMFV